MKQFQFVEGEVLLIDKPLDWTSFDIVNKIKYALKKHYKKLKVGHAGTLDPKATGLLIVCTGKMTKQIQFIQDERKIYTGSFFIGATTPCFDTEQAVDQTFSTTHITDELIYNTAQAFIGKQEQTPPIHSAVKIDGKRAYDYARNDETVIVKSKQINIYNFEITNIAMPLVEFKIECSKGTYIRSIANDFGKKLNSGAYLASLRRTAIGNYAIENAMTINECIDSIRVYLAKEQ
ncbi:MAG: tRNA pseudouridine(55) synthase TruB [Chitinophagales bacterium]|nr:tRNA pseudouridine(55) synthase TruB [Chitinophagales bacterium]